MLYTKETCMVLDETGIHARENCSRLLRSTAVILDTKETKYALKRHLYTHKRDLDHNTRYLHKRLT